MQRFSKIVYPETSRSIHRRDLYVRRHRSWTESPPKYEKEDVDVRGRTLRDAISVLGVKMNLTYAYY